MITSRQNPQIKRIRALHSKRFRTETGLLLAEGTRPVAEALRTGMGVELLVGASDRLRSPFAWQLIQQAAERGIPFLEVSEAVYEHLTGTEGRQGLGAVIRQRWTSLDAVRPEPGRLWVALSAVQYPGNLGTIMRTLEAVGGAGIILLGPCADPYDPAAVRASQGAVFGLSLVRAGVAELAAWKERWGVTVVAADVDAAVSYREALYPSGPLLLLMGAERDGIPADQKALCDLPVRIPMVGHSDSLNLAVAAGVVLYELFHHTHTALASAPTK